MSTDFRASKLKLGFVVSILLIGATFFWLSDSDSSDDAESNGALPAPVEVADEAKLAAGEHRLAADIELGGDTMEWTVAEESTLVFERD